MNKLFTLLFTLTFCLVGMAQNIHPAPAATGPGTPSFQQLLKQVLPGNNAVGDTPTGETSALAINGGQGGVTPPDCNCNPKSKTARVDPYTGNDHREVKDLEVWGGTGEMPLVWIRYANSRNATYVSNYGNAHNWTNSYQYDMKDTGTNVLIHYPAGGQNVFVKSAAAAEWLPQFASGVNLRLFQYGNDFYLQDKNGYRYHFQKLGTGVNTYYQLQDFKDSYQNLYTLTYGIDRRLTRVTEPAGRYLQINDTVVNGVKVIREVVTSDGRSAHYNYTVVNDGTTGVRLTGVNYSDGSKAVYTYVQYQNGTKPYLEHAIDTRYLGDGANMIYSYLSSPAIGFFKDESNGVTGKLMASLDTTSGVRRICYANGGTQTFVTPSLQLGNVNAHTDELGNKTLYTYSAGGVGFRTSWTDASGRMTAYNAQTAYGNFLETTYPDGTKESWTRDSLDLELTHSDELGRVTTYTRNANHQVSRIDHPDGTFETYTYNSFGQVIDHRKKNGGTEHNLYNSRGLKTSFTDAVGNITTYTYNASDLLKTKTDARGNITMFEYNDLGLVTKETNADLSFSTYQYDSLGNRETIVNELGKTWATEYDEFSRPKKQTDPLNRITKYAYDISGLCGCVHAENHPTRITLPSGKVTLIEYDLEWRKIRQTEGAGTSDEASTYYEYDAVGNMVAVIDPRGKLWRTYYDVRNRKKSETDPLGNVTEFTFNAVGNLSLVKQPDNGATTSIYDNMDRVKQETDPKGQITKMDYDAEDNLVKLTDAKNNIYLFEYDLLSRETKTTFPVVTFESYTYDAADNLLTDKTRAGDIRSYTYDNRNREITSAWNDGITPAISRSYDNASRPLTTNSSASSLSYNYNDANELLSESQTVAGAGGPKIISFEYNNDGLQSVMTYPGGNKINYGYTGRNQVSSIITEASQRFTYSYDLNGNRINKTMENGTITTAVYDDANRMTSVSNQKGAVSFARFDYGYDNLDRKKFVKRDGGKGDVYAYDAIGQVMEVKYEATNPEGTPVNTLRTVNYSWDASGNRTNINDNGTITNYSTNNLNQYTIVGANVLTYTANANLRTWQGWTYTYDAQNRLTKAEKGSTLLEFAYDPQNRCVRQAVNGVVMFLYYDHWSLIEERNPAGTILNSYVNGTNIDEVLKKTSSSNTVYFHYDAIGSTIRLTASTGNVVEQYTYDIFGMPTIKDGNGSIIASSGYDNRLLFTGREFIKEPMLYDYRNRMYSPELGRFLQTDPLDFTSDNNNLYTYVGNNPINFVDPFGEITEKDCNDIYEKDRKDIQKSFDECREKCTNDCDDTWAGLAKKQACFLGCSADRARREAGALVVYKNCVGLVLPDIPSKDKKKESKDKPTKKTPEKKKPAKKDPAKKNPAKNTKKKSK